MDYLRVAIEKFGRDYIGGPETGSDEIQYNCPFCLNKRGKADKDRKLYVNIRKGKFHCFKCDSKGRFTSKIESSSQVYDNILNYKNKHNEVQDDLLNDNMFFFNNIKISTKSLAYSYLIDRGFTDHHIKRYNMKLGINELFGRIVIPNIVYAGTWTDMFSCRSYINQTPKYYNPPGAKKTDSVFNLHNIPQNCDDLYINEGALTSIAAGENSCGLYGCSPSVQQISSIANKNPRRIHITLDNDEAGNLHNEELANELCNLLPKSEVFICYLPKGKDAADLGEKLYKEYVSDNEMIYSSGPYSSVFSYFNKTKGGD